MSGTSKNFFLRFLNTPFVINLHMSLHSIFRRLYYRFKLDVSKQSIASLEELIQQPLKILNAGNGVGFLKHLFPPTSGTTALPFDFDVDISLSASAHIGVLGE